MIKEFIFYDNLGCITQQQQGTIREAELTRKHTGFNFIEHARVDITKFVVVNGELKPISGSALELPTQIRSTEVIERDIRFRRNILLAQSDWTQLPDVPLATKEAWATYRQALRDITDQSDPLNIVWPTPPA